MEQAYEVINYTGPKYKFSVLEENYCVPHVHKEIELGLVLSGEQKMIYGDRNYLTEAGDFWLVNSFQSHESVAVPSYKAYTVIVLQILPEFFEQYFPQMEFYRFEEPILNRKTIGFLAYRKLRADFLGTVMDYMEKKNQYELMCAARINLLFGQLLCSVPWHELDKGALELSDLRMHRIQRIDKYIEEHCTEKLLLSDLAEQEGLTLTYLSHLFKDSFGIPFQTYLSRVRCRKARAMLRDTNTSITEISIICGFSALKYLNQGFEELYACTPKEYREACRAGDRKAAETEKALDGVSNDKSAEDQIQPVSDKRAKVSFLTKGLHVFSPEQSLRLIEQYLMSSTK